ncbi:MAG: dTMP kinase [Elusimicrobia bacterium]|nr:dTMP kinase [Elusimicrobiota bacterium]
MKRGFFITFEGGEGSGKSTQARRLVAALRRRGLRPVHTREPGGTAIAEAVRRVLLTPGGRVAPLTELLLYEAARAQHLFEVVRPALARGTVVVCERYTDATEAYQGSGRGLPLADIRRLNRVATGGLAPDLTFLLDVPVRRGLRVARRLGKKLARRAGRSRGGDRMERESPLFHERVRRGYLALARREPRRVRVVPWGDPIEKIHARVLGEVERRLRARR